MAIKIFKLNGPANTFINSVLKDYPDNDIKTINDTNKSVKKLTANNGKVNLVAFYSDGFHFFAVNKKKAVVLPYNKLKNALQTFDLYFKDLLNKKTKFDFDELKRLAQPLNVIFDINKESNIGTIKLNVKNNPTLLTFGKQNNVPVVIYKGKKQVETKKLGVTPQTIFNILQSVVDRYLNDHNDIKIQIQEEKIKNSEYQAIFNYLLQKMACKKTINKNGTIEYWFKMSDFQETICADGKNIFVLDLLTQQLHDSKLDKKSIKKHVAEINNIKNIAIHPYLSSYYLINSLKKYNFTCKKINSTTIDFFDKYADKRFTLYDKNKELFYKLSSDNTLMPLNDKDLDVFIIKMTGAKNKLKNSTKVTANTNFDIKIDELYKTLLTISGNFKGVDFNLTTNSGTINLDGVGSIIKAKNNKFTLINPLKENSKIETNVLEKIEDYALYMYELVNILPSPIKVSSQLYFYVKEKGAIWNKVDGNDNILYECKLNNHELFTIRNKVKKNGLVVSLGKSELILKEEFLDQIYIYIEKYIKANKDIFNKNKTKDSDIKVELNKISNNDSLNIKEDETKEKSSIKEEIKHNDKLENIRLIWSNLDLTNPNKEEIQSLCDKYDELDENELMDSDIKEIHEKLINNTLNNLQDIKSDSTKTRNIYISKKIKDKLPIKDNEFYDILDQIRELDTKSLFNYFVKQKQLVYIYDFLKIRIHNGRVERLVFVMGDKLNKNPEDIYLYEYIEDHKFEHLKDVDITKVDFELLEENIELDARQIDLSKSYYSPYKPLICTGCAGSGKTLISVRMYENIVNDYFLNQDFTKKDLIYLTYNENCLNAVRPLIIKRCPICHAYTIKDFFIDIFYENKTIEEKQNIAKNFVDENHFFNWWNNKRSLDDLSDHRLKEKLYEYKNNTDARFAYTFFRGYFKGQLSSKTDVLTKEDFIKTIKHKEEPISNNESDLDSLYNLFEIYQNLLTKNNLFDDNDLAHQVIKASENHLISLYDRIIVDEVQDLTEVQLDAIIKCSKDKLRLYLFGDQNQSINPTLFDIDMIEKCFKQNNVNQAIAPEKLTLSYRFGPLLAKYMNGLKGLINSYIGSTGSIEETSCLMLEDSKWGARVSDPQVADILLRNSINNAYQMIIVPDEQVKKELIDKYGENIRTKILTIFDSKGLEWRSVILYKMIGFNESKYIDIFKENARKSTLHRMAFNQYYVGVTRARNSFIVIEDDNLNKNIETKLLSSLQEVTLDSVNFYSYENNDAYEWINEGKRMFKLGQYQYAFNVFLRVSNADSLSKDDIESINAYYQICQYMIDKTYTNNSALYCKNHGFYQEAYNIYKQLNNINQVNLMRMYLNEKINDNDIIKLLKEEILDDDDLKTINKFGFKENLKSNIDNGLNNINKMMKEFKN